jgi:hypothetical protein
MKKPPDTYDLTVKVTPRGKKDPSIEITFEASRDRIMAPGYSAVFQSAVQLFESTMINKPEDSKL